MQHKKTHKFGNYLGHVSIYSTESNLIQYTFNIKILKSY